MKYEIDSKALAFSGSEVVEFFEVINEICQKRNTNYIVVGAFARDLILHNIFGKKAGIETRDIDLGIALADWDSYRLVVADLTTRFGYRQGKYPHEFISPNGLLTDILPYGVVENARSISFPRVDNLRINMMGFSEAWKTRLTINLDRRIEFCIPSPEGIILLKLMAWKDRTPSPVALKHVTDIAMILDEYFDACVDQVARDPVFADAFDLSGEPVELHWFSAVVVGRKIEKMIRLFPETRSALIEVFDAILERGKEQLFLEKMNEVFKTEMNIGRGVAERFIQEIRRIT